MKNSNVEDIKNKLIKLNLINDNDYIIKIICIDTNFSETYQLNIKFNHHLKPIIIFQYSKFNNDIKIITTDSKIPIPLYTSRGKTKDSTRIIFSKESYIDETKKFMDIINESESKVNKNISPHKKRSLEGKIAEEKAVNELNKKYKYVTLKDNSLILNNVNKLLNSIYLNSFLSNFNNIDFHYKISAVDIICFNDLNKAKEEIENIINNIETFKFKDIIKFKHIKFYSIKKSNKRHGVIIPTERISFNTDNINRDNIVLNFINDSENANGITGLKILYESFKISVRTNNKSQSKVMLEVNNTDLGFILGKTNLKILDEFKTSDRQLTQNEINYLNRIKDINRNDDVIKTIYNFANSFLRLSDEDLKILFKIFNSQYSFIETDIFFI